MNLKKLCIILLLGSLLVPAAAYASPPDNESQDEVSRLPKITDTCLGDAITTDNQVEINDGAPTDLQKGPAAEKETVDQATIKQFVETYNKSVFLSIIGHPNDVDVALTEDPALRAELNARNVYLGENYGGGSTFTSYDFKLNYDDLSIDGDKAKVIITRNITFQTSFDDVAYPVDADLVQQEGYVFKKTDGNWKLVNVIFNSEGIQNNAMDALSKSCSSEEWVNDFAFANLKRDQYEDTMTFSEMLDGNGEIHLEERLHPYVERSAAYENPALLLQKANRAGYSKAACEAYAVKYGNTVNNAYRWFDRDCTNFVSQCIYAGGLPQNSHWYYKGSNNYSRSWTVVTDLRDFLMNYTLTEGFYQSLSNYPAGVKENGTLIQYSNGSKWVHSAIIRKVNSNGIYVAEHDGPASSGHPNGNYSFHLHGNNLSRTRTFWIAKG